MARKSSPTITQDELYPPDEEFARQDIDDARLLDLDVEQESPFLRAQKRVSVRRGSLPKKAAVRLKWALLGLTGLFLLAIGAGIAYRYGEHSWRFRIESSDDIEITGIHSVTHSQIMEVLGGDIGRNIFFVPLAQRKTQLEQIPWVESASVMRFVPNRLKVEIHERTPVAFARIGPRISLIDAGGTLMELPTSSKKKYSFPVILGMNPGEPLSTRNARMKIYNDLTQQLDSSGARYSQDLSEVDLSDADDIKVSVGDPSGTVLVHLGSSNFLDRFKIYVTHVREWRQQFAKLESVDLRYDRQIIVNPDLRSGVKPTPIAFSAAKAAIAAGVKPAALISRETVKSKTVVSPLPRKVVVQPALRPNPKRKTGKWARSRHHRKTVTNSSLSSVSIAKNVAKTSQVVPAAPPGSATRRTPLTQNTVPGTSSISAKPADKKKPSPAITKSQDQGKDQEDP
jgi:cell division protein FtsQ